MLNFVFGSLELLNDSTYFSVLFLGLTLWGLVAFIRRTVLG